VAGTVPALYGGFELAPFGPSLRLEEVGNTTIGPGAYSGPVSAVTAGTSTSAEQLEQYRRELVGYCYRMLGSIHEAQDAVQDTMLRAWRALATFEDRAGLRPWLYRIATNVCIDMGKGRSRPVLRTWLEVI
jgi:DNA-directed RNA polymerase specialized sigma24 family protein